jgi:hypothetical protein
VDTALIEYNRVKQPSSGIEQECRIIPNQGVHLGDGSGPSLSLLGKAMTLAQSFPVVELQ